MLCEGPRFNNPTDTERRILPYLFCEVGNEPINLGIIFLAFVLWKPQNVVVVVPYLRIGKWQGILLWSRFTSARHQHL